MISILNRLPRFVSNSISTVISQIIPIAIGVVTIPICIHRFEIEKFGLLTLVWTIVGYFAFADLGLGRAIVKLVAERVDQAKVTEIPKILGTSLGIVMFISGILIAGLLAISEPLVTEWLKIPLALESEAISCLNWLSVTVLSVTLLSCVKGFLEGVHDFHFSNFVQLVMGTSNYMVPLIVSIFSKSILLTVMTLSLVRWVALVVHWVYARQKYGVYWRSIHFDPQWVRRLIRFGGWITVGNIITATRIYMDRFILSATAGLSVLAYYATPIEVLTRVLVVPGSLIRIVFPLLSQSQADEPEKLEISFGRSLKMFTFLMWLAVSAFSFLAYWVLSIWISKDFADHAAHIMQTLALAFFINGCGWLGFATLQSIERADISTKIFAFNFVLFVPAFYFSTQHWGIEGAPYVRLVFEFVDIAFLYIAVMYFRPTLKATILNFFGYLMLGAFLLALPQLVASSKVHINILLFVLSVLLYASAFVTIVLSRDDRNYLSSIVGSMLGNRAIANNSYNNSVLGTQTLHASPKVTLVIPCYNQERIIGKAIQSALAQTYKNLEILIVDDASQDNTFAAAAEFSNDARLRLVRHERNIGRVANYRKSIYELATGDWIINVDADDYLIDPDFISDAIAVAQKDPQICLVFGKLKRLDLSTGHSFNHAFKKFKDINDGNSIILSYWKYGEGIPHLTSLYKRQLAIERDTRSIDHLFDDTESFFKIIAGNKVAFIDRYVGIWTMHSGNSSRTVDIESRLKTYAMVDSPYNFFKEKMYFSDWDLKKWRYFMLVRMTREHICNFLDNGNISMAFKFVRRVAQRYNWKIALLPFLSYRVIGRLISKRFYRWLFKKIKSV